MVGGVGAAREQGNGHGHKEATPGALGVLDICRVLTLRCHLLDIVLRIDRISPLGGLGQGCTGAPCYSLQLHVNLQLPQIKKCNLKNINAAS